MGRVKRGEWGEGGNKGGEREGGREPLPFPTPKPLSVHQLRIPEVSSV